MILGFGNNVITSLAADISSTQTTITVMPGTGEQFSALLAYEYTNKSNSPKIYGKITLTDSGETTFEICHLISVSGDTLTVLRGQEGTTAKGWNLNDVVANFATKGSESTFVQAELLQSGHFTSGVAGGSANALTLELPTTFFLNGSTDWVLRTPIVVYPGQNNTGAATLQLTMGNRVLGTYPLYKGNKAQLVANDILKDVALVCLLDNSKTFFNVANPGAIYAGLGTAAFKDIVTSTTDSTSGRIPTVGWMGFGGPEIGLSDDVDIYKYFATAKSGLYGGGGLLTNSIGSGWHSLKWQQHGSDHKYGVLLDCCSDGKTSVHIYHNANGDMTNPENYWTACTLYGTKNKPSPSDVGAVPTSRTVNGHALTENINVTSQDIFNGQAINIGENQNLDNYQTPGVYYQAANANTSAALNYPENNAGTLLVLKNAGMTQVYYVYNSSRIWTRSKYSTGAWTAWAREYNTLNKPSAADVGALPLSGGVLTGPLTGAYTESFSFADQYNTKAPFYHAFTTSGVSEYHPLTKIRAWTSTNAWVFTQGVLVSNTVLSYYLYCRGSAGQDISYKWDTSGNFTAPGLISPGNWTNFDNRYQLKNTASKAANGWFKDTSTGMITQWGTASGGNDDQYYTVNTPIAFPTAFVSLQVYPIYPGAITSGHTLASAGKINSTSQFGYGISDGASGSVNAQGVYWIAIGY